MACPGDAKEAVCADACEQASKTAKIGTTGRSIATLDERTRVRAVKSERETDL